MQTPQRPALMVFSDLDGTLIDHETYAFDAASEALAALAARRLPLILASSKTAPEMAKLRQQMALTHWPAIVENGAGLLPPDAEDAPDSSDYQFVRAALARLPAALRTHFVGFGDLSTGEVAKMTQLPEPDAARARQRSFSEPGLWSGTKTQKQTFLNVLSQMGVEAQQGGRFLTLSRGSNKVHRMRALVAEFCPRRTIALGDAPNDVAMLEAADQGIVVANPYRPPLPPLAGEDTGRIQRTTAPGPEGWNAAVLALLEQLDQQ